MIVPVFELEWRDPPTPAAAAYEPILRELRARPGKWARVQKDRSTSNGAASWAKLGCEAKAIRANPGEKPPRYDIYVRWPALPQPEPKRPSEGTVKAVTNGTAVVQRPPLPSPGSISTNTERERFAAARAARGVPADGIPVEYLKGNQH